MPKFFLYTLLTHSRFRHGADTIYHNLSNRPQLSHNSNGIVLNRSVTISISIVIPPVYEVYRGYIVFAFSMCVFVC